MHNMLINIIKKSIYEYYVGLKFRLNEEKNTTNIFAKNNEFRVKEFDIYELETIIDIIEKKWVEA